MNQYQGEMGKLERRGNKVQGRMCGRWFRSLVHHVGWKHSLTPEAYRAQFGLKPNEPLASGRERLPLSPRRVAAVSVNIWEPPLSPEHPTKSRLDDGVAALRSAIPG